MSPNSTFPRLLPITERVTAVPNRPLDEARDAAQEVVLRRALAQVQRLVTRIGQFLAIESFLSIEHRQRFRIENPNVNVGKRSDVGSGSYDLVVRCHGLDTVFAQQDAGQRPASSLTQRFNEQSKPLQLARDAALFQRAVGRSRHYDPVPFEPLWHFLQR